MSIPQKNSLVLYRDRPAIVKKTGDRPEIELEDGRTQKGRPKDVALLHSGPLAGFTELTEQEGDLETAWELLGGEGTDIGELADLIYGTYSPATAWAAWQHVEDRLFFTGTPDQVLPRTEEEVERKREERKSKVANQQAWAAFLERARAGTCEHEDAGFLEEVEELALGQKTAGRALKELGRKETAENAHALLLEVGHWDESRNPHPARRSVRALPPSIQIPELPEEDRLDLTHLPAFAIDDAGSDDPDDALSVEGDRLWVHVADVAALVKPDSEADLEARARGSNLYLPEGAVHMLPAVATGKLGLGLADRSPALSFGLDVNSSGEIENVEVAPSTVQVTRLTYADAEARLDEDPFNKLCHWAEASEARRTARGAAMIELPEVRIWLEDGRVNIVPLPPLKSRALVREAMLLVGEAVATFAVKNEIPFPFSTQEPPDERERLDGLAGMFALRRSFKRSKLRSVPGPHGGMGLDIYAQVTSPLRRYLDLVVHQQIRTHLLGVQPLDAQELLERVGAAEAVSDSLRSAERLSRRHWTLVYLKQNLDWKGFGILVDRRRQNGVMLIPELGMDAAIYLNSEVPLNTGLQLSIGEVNLPELTAHFKIETT